MAFREEVLFILNEIKEHVQSLEDEHFIEILNGNKEKNILGLKDILHQMIIEKYHYGSKQIIGILNRRYEYTDENDSGGKVDKICDICDDLIEQVNYWYKDKHKSIVYGSSDIKKVFELYTYYWESY